MNVKSGSIGLGGWPIITNALPEIAFLNGGLGNRFNLRSQYEFAVAQGWI